LGKSRRPPQTPILLSLIYFHQPPPHECTWGPGVMFFWIDLFPPSNVALRSVAFLANHFSVEPCYAFLPLVLNVQLLRSLFPPKDDMFCPHVPPSLPVLLVVALDSGHQSEILPQRVSLGPCVDSPCLQRPFPRWNPPTFPASHFFFSSERFLCFLSPGRRLPRCSHLSTRPFRFSILWTRTRFVTGGFRSIFPNLPICIGHRPTFFDFFFKQGCSLR